MSKQTFLFRDHTVAVEYVSASYLVPMCALMIFHFQVFLVCYNLIANSETSENCTSTLKNIEGLFHSPSWSLVRQVGGFNCPYAGSCLVYEHTAMSKLGFLVNLRTWKIEYIITGIRHNMYLLCGLIISVALFSLEEIFSVAIVAIILWLSLISKTLKTWRKWIQWKPTSKDLQGLA